MYNLRQNHKAGFFVLHWYLVHFELPEDTKSTFLSVGFNLRKPYSPSLSILFSTLFTLNLPSLMVENINFLEVVVATKALRD